ncbi:MAG TPA: hypothetical protein VNA11_04915 [Pseudonocardia sp.]|nr:hypothetical protein [Pseudonocardia sp.]
MSEIHLDAFPTRPVERAGRSSRLVQWFADRALRRDVAAIEAEQVGDIKWRWRKACEHSGLGRMVFTPSGPTVSFPLIGQVVLGPPTTFTVRPQPGQLRSDFEAAAPRIAVAMGVPAVRVRALAGDWLVIELMDGPTSAPQAQHAEVVELAPRRMPGWSPVDLAAA